MVKSSKDFYRESLEAENLSLHALKKTKNSYQVNERAFVLMVGAQASMAMAYNQLKKEINQK